MRIAVQPQNQNKQRWFYFVVFLFVMVSKDTLLFGTNNNSLWELIHYFIAVLVFLGLLYYTYAHTRLVIDGQAFLVTLILIILSLLTFVFSIAAAPLKYGYECLLYLIALLFVVNVPFAEFKKTYVDVMTFLSVASLAFFIIRYTFPSVLTLAPTITNDVGYKFYYWGVCVVPYDFKYIAFRNYGVFREPGVFQIFLNVALAFCSFTDQIKITKRYLFALTILTTFSTTGYIVCVLIMVFSLLSKKVANTAATKTKILDWLCCTLLLMSVLLANTGAYIDIDNTVFRKLFIENDSLNSRLISVFANFHMFKQNVLFGKGYEFVEENFKIVATSFWVYTNNNTNTFFKILSVHGIFSFALMFSGFCLMIRKHFDKRFFVIFSIVLILLLSSEDMIFNILTYVLMLYGYTNGNDDRNIENEKNTDKQAVSTC